MRTEDILRKIKTQRPVIQCITNSVTVNDCANILLAAGASPTMAHHIEEVKEVAEKCGALVCNMGAVEYFDAMILAGMTAKEKGHPVIFDPVGAAGSTFRRNKCVEFIEKVKPDCIRGNLTEIKALFSNQNTGTGVDAAKNDFVNENNVSYFSNMLNLYSEQTGACIIASGKTDLICYMGNVEKVTEGDELMSRITGSGCMSTALLGAFLSMENSFAAACNCCKMIGMAGETAAKRVRALNGGTMSFKTEFIDEIYRISEKC